MTRPVWTPTTWQAEDRYTVDGDQRVYDDPGEAKRVAESRSLSGKPVFARRLSDGKPINFYAAEMRVPEMRAHAEKVSEFLHTTKRTWS